MRLLNSEDKGIKITVIHSFNPLNRNMEYIYKNKRTNSIYRGKNIAPVVEEEISMSKEIY